MTTPRYRDQAIALAAVLQCCWLIDQLAKTGVAAKEELNPLINSLFSFDPETTESVYGSVTHLKRGLRILDEMLSGTTPRNYGDTLRYALGVIHLQGKLEKDATMLATLRKRLEHISFKNEHFTDDNYEIARSVAGLYQETISNFKFRIQVT